VRTRSITVAVAVGLGALALAPGASAKEKVLTLYSPRLVSLPYVHKTYQVDLRANGREAPKAPGYVLGFKEQVLVDSKDPKAKPLPIGKMMVHHFLYFAPGRLDEGPGCWQGSGFLSGRGEEHPDGQLGAYYPKGLRDGYGMTNRTADGRAPAWRLTAMVMNHYRRAKAFYVRTRVWYTTERRTPVYPTVVGKCAQLANGMAYDVPGGGRPGSNFVDANTWTVPAGFTGRIIGAHSHQHGGAKYMTLASVSCHRRLLKARAYYGTPDHIYNTIRPILHEPGPIANGTFAAAIPIHAGEVLKRTAVHDGHNLHVAGMGFWTLLIVKDPGVQECAPMAKPVEIGKPARYDHHPNYDKVVPQLVGPTSAWTTFTGRPLTVGDEFFRPGRVVVRRGQTLSWRFSGQEPHSVSVANGPRGFSSIYWGRTSGTYSVKLTVKGTYRLTCLVHPTTMGETVVVK
jgi:hypothetical protein